jgi:tetratricopeptide (TPR) repeat protein
MRIALLALFIILTISNLTGQSEVEEYLSYAIAFTESKRNEEAIIMCDKLTDLLPGNPDIFFLRGVNKYLIKDYEGAIYDFDIALEISPNHTDALLFRARAKKGNRDYLGSLRDYNSARTKNLYETISSLTTDFMTSLLSRRNN